MSTNDYETNAPANGRNNLDLAQLDEDFGQAPVEAKEYEAIPDGKYQARVERVELTRSKTSGHPMLKWTLRILAPRCQGRLLWRYNVLASKDQLKWLKTDLHTCGLDLEKLSDLPDHLEQLLGVGLEINKRTKEDRDNVFFNKRIEIVEVPEGVPESGRLTDVPF